MREGIKLLAMDLDGTLLDSRDRVSETNRQAIRDAAAAGVVPVIASGRIREEAQYVVDALPEVRYFVGMNGGLVEDLHAGTVIQDLPLDGKVAQNIMERLDAAGFFFQIYAQGGVYCLEKWINRLHESGMSGHYLAMQGDKIRAWIPEERERTTVYKMLAVAPNPLRIRELRALAANFPGIEVLCSLPSYGYHEILPAGIDKGKALAVLCEWMGIGSRDVLAIGDSENDSGMLRFASRSVAVGNAVSSLRDIAEFVAPSNDRDGVAATIRRYFFS